MPKGVAGYSRERGMPRSCHLATTMSGPARLQHHGVLVPALEVGQRLERQGHGVELAWRAGLDVLHRQVLVEMLRPQSRALGVQDQGRDLAPVPDPQHAAAKDGPEPPRTLAGDGDQGGWPSGSGDARCPHRSVSIYRAARMRLRVAAATPGHGTLGRLGRSTGMSRTSWGRKPK